MDQQQLVEIFLPNRRGDGSAVERGWFNAFVKELSDKFGGVTSFARAPGEGLWEEGKKTEKDDIAVIEVMVKQLDELYWSHLKARLERELQQEEIVIRASAIGRL